MREPVTTMSDVLTGAALPCSAACSGAGAGGAASCASALPVIATMLAPIASDDAKILCLDIGLSSPWTQCVGSLAHACHYYPGVHFYFYRSSGGCQLIL